VAFRIRRVRRAALPTPGAIRRERRALLAMRDDQLRDLGGLIFEMFRYDRFNEELVRERCTELLDLDERLAELEELHRAATNSAPLLRCASCGAELAPSSHFCSNCGNPAGSSAQGGEIAEP
jgi:zinc-ribbon domain